VFHPEVGEVLDGRDRTERTELGERRIDLAMVLRATLGVIDHRERVAGDRGEKDVLPVRRDVHDHQRVAAVFAGRPLVGLGIFADRCVGRLTLDLLALVRAQHEDVERLALVGVGAIGVLCRGQLGDIVELGVEHVGVRRTADDRNHDHECEQSDQELAMASVKRLPPSTTLAGVAVATLSSAGHRAPFQRVSRLFCRFIASPTNRACPDGR
jgi:hypothetical protein